MGRLRILGLASLAMAAAACVVALAATTAEAGTVGTARLAGGAVSGYAIERDGSLWAWGVGSSGELGLGDTRARRFAHRVGTGTSWTTVAPGFGFCLALKRDGSLWAWGANDLGQLGLGVKNNSPHLRRQRVGARLWSAIGAGTEFSVAIRGDGTLWAWGNNSVGRLGTGSVPPFFRSLRTRVGTDSDWRALAAGPDNVLALKRDGSLWAWGGNEFGQLGFGSTDRLPHATPVRVGTDTDWTAVSTSGLVSLALKRDGSLWSWGGNGAGELGLGDTVDRSVPTRVGTGSAWKAASAGNEFCLGLKRNGTLWAWGRNADGELGMGNRVELHAPARLGHLTDWTQAVAADYFSLAIRDGGVAYVWGNNHVGQLGLGDTRNRSTPNRIPRLP